MAQKNKTSRAWSFTCWDDDWTTGAIQLSDVKYLCMGYEPGEEDNWHFQGYVEFNSPIRLRGAKRVMGSDMIHMEWSRADWKKNYDYITKFDKDPVIIGEPGGGQGKRTDYDAIAKDIKSGYDMKMLDEKYPAYMLRCDQAAKRMIDRQKVVKCKTPDIILRPWQQRLMEYIYEGPVRRRILWIWSKSSSTGKTTMSDYITAECGGLTKVVHGIWKQADMEHMYDEHEIIIFNMARREDFMYRHQELLEKVSDQGYYANAKYYGKRTRYNAVIIVFSNKPPPAGDMPDRIISCNVDSENGEWTDYTD